GPCQIYWRSRVPSSGARQQNLRAIELLQEALKLDPGFAAAQARMAYRTFFLGYYDDPKYLDLSIEQARKAIEMDPALARAHLALASGYAVKGWGARARQG